MMRKMSTSMMHQSRRKYVHPCKMTSCRLPARNTGKQCRSSETDSWSMQYLSIHTRGSRPCCSRKQQRHSCSASHLASTSSCQLWLMKASTLPSFVFLVSAFSPRPAWTGSLAEKASFSTLSIVTLRQRDAALAMSSAGSMPPTTEATAAALGNMSAIAAASICVRSGKCGRKSRTTPRRANTAPSAATYDHQSSESVPPSWAGPPRRHESFRQTTPGPPVAQATPPSAARSKRPRPSTQSSSAKRRHNSRYTTRVGRPGAARQARRPRTAMAAR
mmetsp:Transcript_72452/g.221845  ORF Transcript_72452/g.221845 Transcript_72452/m.221845 type:complete len:275 (-) Transcript_72452:701-1525(-)